MAILEPPAVKCKRSDVPRLDLFGFFDVAMNVTILRFTEMRIAPVDFEGQRKAM